MPVPTSAFPQLKKALVEGIPAVARTGVEILDLEHGYVKMSMPFEPNINHVGIMYAGSLFTLAELPAGAIYATGFDSRRYYIIVKDLQLSFRRPAKTDVTVEVRLSAEEIDEIQARADKEGKAEFSWNCELKDANDEVVATSVNVYQIRKIGS
jgi:thioesterase domain-containing protein